MTSVPAPGAPLPPFRRNLLPAPLAIDGRAGERWLWVVGKDSKDRFLPSKNPSNASSTTTSKPDGAGSRRSTTSPPPPSSSTGMADDSGPAGPNNASGRPASAPASPRGRSSTRSGIRRERGPGQEGCSHEEGSPGQGCGGQPVHHDGQRHEDGGLWEVHRRPPKLSLRSARRCCAATTHSKGRSL